MAGSARDRRRIASAWALSVAGHAALIAAGAALALQRFSERPLLALPPPAPPLDQVVEIDLPVMSDGSVATDATPAPLPADELARGGGEGIPRPDTGATGRGGTDHAAAQALNLADRDDALLLSPEILSRLDRNQIQRQRSARHRAAYEDWRASREPMELTFLASGRRARPERRRPADHDPSLGARAAAAPERLGLAAGAAPLPPGEGQVQRPPGAAEPGSDRTAPGLGVRDGAPGDDHRDSAAVAFGRPMVQQGTPSVPASEVGRPHDTVDSEQEVALTVQSLLHASAAGGAPGPGAGGQQAPGPAAAGGTAGAGSIARPLGSGPGAALDNDLRDQRRSQYLRQVMARIHPLWANAFPRWAAAEGLQGTVTVAFVIRGDGTVASATIARPSGIAEFDENCRRAVLRGAPYPPLPPELGSQLSWAMPFHASNPAVLPRRP